MKQFLLIFGFIVAFPIVLLAAESNPPKATLNVGIYYTIGLSNFNDVENLILSTENTINSFFPRKIIDVNIVFLEYWEISKSTSDTKDIFAMFNEVNKPSADIYLILHDSILTETFKGIEYRYGGMTNNFGGNKIILGGIVSALAAKDGFIELLLLHELGHKFGMHHTDSEICERKMMLMCFKSALSKEVIVDNAFIKALYYYYSPLKTKRHI